MSSVRRTSARRAAQGHGLAARKICGSASPEMAVLRYEVAMHIFFPRIIIAVLLWRFVNSGIARRVRGRSQKFADGRQIKLAGTKDATNTYVFVNIRLGFARTSFGKRCI